MCDVEFNIPINKEALLESSSDSYYVRDIYIISSLKDHLKAAKNAFHYDGPEAVINNFDTYFSVLYHGEKLGIDQITNVLNDLTKPCNQLSTYLNNVFTNGEMLQETQLKTLNILKMIIYLLTQFTILLENKIDTKEKTDLTNVKKGRKVKTKKSDDIDFEIDFNKKKQLEILLSLLDQPIYKLWNPPVCEEQFINLISDVCFAHLTNVSMKYEKELCNIIFCIFGVLIKNYNYSMTLTVRLAQAIIDHEHLQAIVPSGIKLLVEEYNCSGLVRELVRELTEWQSDENRNDVPGSRHCSFILTEMTAQMPELMLPEVVYLLQYLNSNSYTLRNCILSIITEVILNVLCKENLSDEHIQIRNKLLQKLRNYICDMNAHVRSKVLQHWTKLHSEQAIPNDMQLAVLKKAVGRLKDKGTLVRKSALQLVTTFVRCNSYAATLDLDYYKKELKNEMNTYNSFNLGSTNDMLSKLKTKEDEWSKIVEDIREVVEDCLENDDEEMATDAAKSQKLLRAFLTSKKYKQAFYLCRDLVIQDDKHRDEIEEMEIEKRVDFYLTFMQSVYTEMNKEAMELIHKNFQQLAQLTPEQIEEIRKCEQNVKYLTDVIEFLEIIESIFPTITIFLKSASMSDVHEAIEFCVTAHQFKIKSAPKGLAAMLTQMNTTEQDRKTAVIDAYRTVFLVYEGPPKDKPTVLVNRLIDLIKSINANDVHYLSDVIRQWTEKGVLDASIIQQLWYIFIGRGAVAGENVAGENVSDDDRVVALDLLSMIAAGRKTIIERNVNLVAEIIFSEKGIEDPRFFITGCNMLGLMEEEVVVTKKEPCFRISFEDNIWEQLNQSLLKIFLKKDPFCYAVITAAIQLIFKICQRPEALCERVISTIESAIKDPNVNIIENDKIDPTYLAFFCHLIGEIAIREFIYLDETVYKELKRRNFCRDERKKTQKQKKNESFNVSKASASVRANATNVEDPDESYLEGAKAGDEEAEFVLHVCEFETVKTDLLSEYVPMFIHILRHPHKIDNELVQAAASQALMRCMTVSNVLCEEMLNLIITILEKSKYTSVKNNIFVCLADLLHRFPNLVEPYSPNIFQVVKDKNEAVRMTAVSVLSKLIMEDMMRVKGTIADLALCIVDPCEEIVQMTEDFFAQLAQKGNAIYNVLPDVISRLSNDKDQIDEEVFRKVMMFLINLISKDKQIESLVEKLCLRCKMSQNKRVWRDVGFCLSILSYNDKSLIRLCENFSSYKHCLEDDDVYDLFITIVHKNKNSTKDEIKEIVKRFESLIKTGETTSDESPLNETRKKPKGRKGKKARISLE